ncbi:baculoviral IAP repeat-containing protein 2 [Apostichopus japonicus]|uniref:Baculoviral IAP repeat-containing protein 2 n=1 Tax=Stichopus japonicus TaxID=307972 RepID=A0A2G8K8I2_STIJA|nr:baculoviral IAP repeat-containing protein 2 [Apostichopus japonicus]
MACVSEMPPCQKLKMLLLKCQQAESKVADWPAEEIDNHLCEMAQEVKIFPNKKQLKKKLAREKNVTFHDGKPVTVISQGTNSRESVIFIHPMFQESERYLSFFTHRWPPTAPVTASVLAKAGFYYFGVDDTVQCFSCNGRINNWSPGDTAMGEHKRIYPRCKFVKGIDTRNVPARGLLDESTKQSTEGRNNLKSGKSSASQDEAGCSDENISELLQPLNLEESEPPSEAKSYFMKEINRLLSFKIWPISSHVDRFDLAAAGFYCVNESNGTVQCFACFGRLSEWKAGDRPKSEHLRLFPSCPFILGRPTGNVPLTPTEKDQAVRFFSSSSSRLSRPLQIASNLSQSERYGLQGQSSSSRGSSENLGRRAALPEPADLTVKYAKYPNYAYEQARLETYGRWPNNHSQIPANLARAGFFATGNGDEVKCFYCGGGLKDWSIGDEAWEEHARWFTRCEWLLQQRGPAFVDAVQRKFGPSGHSYFEPNMGIPGDENAILPPTSPPAPPLQAKSRPPQLRLSQNQDQRSKGKRKMKIEDKLGRSNQIKRNKERRINQLMKFMVDMGQDETLIKTVIRKRLESGQSPYQTSEELLVAIFEEEERQQAGAVSSVPAEEPASPKKKSNERRVSPDHRTNEGEAT